MNTFMLLLISFIFVACSSSVTERTLAQLEDRPRPEWASQENALVVKEGKIRILGFQELEADAKISAGYRLADSAARAELSKMVQNQVRNMLQNLEEGTSDEGQSARYYAAEISKNALREFRIVKRYWEKVQSFDSEGQPTYRLRLYSQGEIPESHYKKLVRERIEQDKMDPEVKKQVLNHFESEINSFQSN